MPKMIEKKTICSANPRLRPGRCWVARASQEVPEVDLTVHRVVSRSGQTHFQDVAVALVDELPEDLPGLFIEITPWFPTRPVSRPHTLTMSIQATNTIVIRRRLPPASAP